ncbi:MAG: hypothetical protein RXP99_03410 [Vulcanisaeta sp.]
MKIKWLGMDGDMEKSGDRELNLSRELVSLVTPSMRQGLIIINDSKESEMVVRLFTGLIIGKDPERITNWRDEYVSVNEREFQEELKLLAMPLVHEMSVMRAIELPDGREYPVIMRRVYVLLLAPPVGLIIFGQPSTALIVNDDNRVYLGYKGVDVDGGNKITVTIKARAEGVLTVPFTPAVARFIFVGDVVEVVIDDGGQVRGLRH